jgi:hypothetical protein
MPRKPLFVCVALSAVFLSACGDNDIRNDLEYINTVVGEQDDGRQRIRLDGLFTADELEALAVWMRDPAAVDSAS